MSSLSAESVFSFHLAESSVWSTLGAFWRPPSVSGIHEPQFSECMTVMTLGAPIFSPARMQLRHLAMFAAWESHEAIDDFLTATALGVTLSKGWHVRMKFLRRWGRVGALGQLPEGLGDPDRSAPVIAVTLARMRLPQVPRFIHWGKPVEELVRDHPGHTLALAAMRLPRTVSTFTIWKSQDEMLDMVSGHSSVPRPERHAVAMRERERKDFHFEFTTLRFKPLSEHGTWKGRDSIVPWAKPKE